MTPYLRNEFRRILHATITATKLCGTKSIATCYTTYAQVLLLALCDQGKRKKNKKKTYRINNDTAFYACPYVDRKDFPQALASTSQWMFSIKSQFEQTQKRLQGWMVVPAWDKSVFAKMTS